MRDDVMWCVLCGFRVCWDDCVCGGVCVCVWWCDEGDECGNCILVCCLGECVVMDGCGYRCEMVWWCDGWGRRARGLTIDAREMFFLSRLWLNLRCWMLSLRWILRIFILILWLRLRLWVVVLWLWFTCRIARWSRIIRFNNVWCASSRRSLVVRMWWLLWIVVLCWFCWIIWCVCVLDFVFLLWFMWRCWKIWFIRRRLSVSVSVIDWTVFVFLRCIWIWRIVVWLSISLICLWVCIRSLLGRNVCFSFRKFKAWSRFANWRGIGTRVASD